MPWTCLWLPFFCLFYAALGQASSDPSCPNAEEILPCVCSNKQVLRLDCSKVSSEIELQSVFAKNFPVKEFDELRIIRSNAITTLDIDYNGLTFKKFDLFPGKHTALTVSLTKVFPNSEAARNLEAIWLFRTEFEDFPFRLIRGYPKLKSLVFSGSKISSIPLMISQTLAFFRLSYGQITDIAPGTFNSLFKLSQLNLDGNKIKELKTGSIPVPTTATSYNLARNQIRSVQPGTFVLTGTPELNSLSLDLSANALTEISEESFGEIMPYVKRFLIFGNPLSCGPSICWFIKDHLHRVPDFGDPTCADGRRLPDVVC